MRKISELARHWALKSETGKGIRFDASDLDLMNAIGMGQFLLKIAAEEQRKLCEKRISRFTSAENIDSSTIDLATDRFARHTSKSNGMTPKSVVSEAAQRARRAVKRPRGS